MQILNLIKNPQEIVIEKTISVLKKGGLIVYPTETCYGLGADATNKSAVNKVWQFKGQRNKPVLVAVGDQSMAEKYVILNSIARNLYQNFLPGPVAVVSQSKNKVVLQLESTNQTLGIRIPNYPLILKLINAFGRPITSTSANPLGKKTPYSLKDFQKYTSLVKQNMVDLFLDAGQLLIRPPSTVVDTTLNEPTILRQGEIIIPYLINQTFISNSETETQMIAQNIYQRYQNTKQSLILALQGELGSGKTQFAKGLGQALNIKDNITSPTFNLIKEYPFRSGIFYHLDTWRLEKGEELLKLGLEKMLQPGNLMAIEWLQKIKPILEKINRQNQAKVIWITIEVLSETKRRIKYSE